MRWLQMCGGLLLVAGVSGCTVGPHYRPPSVPVPDAWSEAPSQAAARTAATAQWWTTFQDPLLDGVRRRLWARILVLVGWEGAAVLAATHILHMLEVPIRHGRHDVVPGVVKRGHRALDELNALR